MLDRCLMQFAIFALAWLTSPNRNNPCSNLYGKPSIASTNTMKTHCRESKPQRPPLRLDRRGTDPIRLYLRIVPCRPPARGARADAKVTAEGATENPRKNENQCFFYPLPVCALDRKSHIDV